MDEYNVYKFVRIGVFTSIIIFIIGLTIMITNNSLMLNQRMAIDVFFSELINLNPLAIIYLGILALILIPIGSLVYLEVIYLVKKDKKMQILTILTISMLILVIILRSLLF